MNIIRLFRIIMRFWGSSFYWIRSCLHESLVESLIMSLQDHLRILLDIDILVILISTTVLVHVYDHSFALGTVTFDYLERSLKVLMIDWVNLLWITFNCRQLSSTLLLFEIGHINWASSTRLSYVNIVVMQVKGLMNFQLSFLNLQSG